MASPSPSVAAKAFAIPEILEHILCYLGQAGLEEFAYQPSRACMQPLLSLAGVQRVDTMFRDTIKTSKKIQRLLEEGRQRRPWSLSPARWLLQEKLGLDYRPGGMWTYIDVLELDISKGPLRTAFKVFSSGQKAAPEASWRKMEFTFMGYAVTMVDIHKILFPALRYSTLPSYSECLTFDTDTTLGEFFDRYSEIMTRPQAEFLLMQAESWKD